MPDTSRSNACRYSISQRLFQLLGSMDLAITLLLTLAVASIIGTVLQQNQPYTDYLIKFGPFWFELFESAGLYDVYSALWFLAILTLLVISTSVCLIRHTPGMLRDIWNLRTHVQEKSLKAMHHQAQWRTTSPSPIVIRQITQALLTHGFRVKQTPQLSQTLISAMRGGMNRFGYIATHLAIVIICVGGLLDSNLPLKLAEWRGDLKIETRDLPTNDVPEISRLPVGPQAFRGSIHIPEDRSSHVAFVAMRDGYLVQELPFSIEVEDFRIEHYATGQPKSFETDLVIHDSDLDEPLTSTISVNHPLFYKGYAIYQASFSDGGSLLSIEAWPLVEEAGNQVISFDTKVFENRQMTWAGQTLVLEMLSFRPFNINPDPIPEKPDRVRNFGPSFGFKLRSETGEALEYMNYMLPVEKEGRSFYLSGVRSSPADEFGFLYLPVDGQGGLASLSHFITRLHDDVIVRSSAHQMMSETLSTMTEYDRHLEQTLEDTLVSLVAMFIRGGFNEVGDFIEAALPEAERNTLGTAYLGMLREMLARIYFSDKPLKDADVINETQLLFLQDAIDAIGSLPRYSSPVFLMLTDYEHIEASGLQIARSPGKPVVYTGCALLIMGVFLLFYLPQRRFWLIVKDNDAMGYSVLLLAGMSNRNPRDFDVFFEQMHDNLHRITGNYDENQRS